MNQRWVSISAVCIAFAGGIIVGRALPDGVVNPPAIAAVRPVAEGSARRVRMPPALRAHAGIATEPLRASRFTQSLELHGGVEFDGDHFAEVGSRIPGRIARILVRPGDEVRAGQVLAEIESAAVGEAVAQLASARAVLVASRADFARVESLAARNLATGRELEQARAARATHEAMAQGATQRLLALGITSNEVQGIGGGHRVTVRAPLAGRVVERHAVLGQVVEPATTLFRVADPSRLWVQLRVFERDLPRVRMGDPVTLRVASLPDRDFHGTVGHISPALDHDTRTARVRVEVTDAESLLRPGQFVEAQLRPSAGRVQQALRIPRDATVQIEGRDAAFVEVGDGLYELRVLEVGAADSEHVEVLRGVNAGERLVVRGAFALKSELLR